MSLRPTFRSIASAAVSTLVALAAAATSQAEVVLFDGSTDTPLLASRQNGSFILANLGSGAWYLTHGAGGDRAGQMFGTFSPTTLSTVGDKITIGFTISSIPPGSNSPLYISLSGASRCSSDYPSHRLCHL